MTTFYNEWDHKTAAWLRELAKQGHVTEGIVDERSIKDIKPDELRGYRRCHFFAGIGGWDYALRLAGWPDDRPVWTGSCPCQPFSSAGKRKGQADERHLWPDWFRLIRECRPDCIFGEQVASAIGHGWLDGVFADLEAEGYTCGAVVLGAHSVGAPHIRQRLWWCASRRMGNTNGAEVDAAKSGQSMPREGCDGVLCGLAESANERHERGGSAWAGRNGLADNGADSGLGYAASSGLAQGDGAIQTRQCGETDHWNGSTTIPCGDGKTRRLEPGISPLVDGTSARVVRSGDYDVENTAEARVTRLKGYGNAIVPQVAASFIRAFMETAATTKGEYGENI